MIAKSVPEVGAWSQFGFGGKGVLKRALAIGVTILMGIGSAGAALAAAETNVLTPQTGVGAKYGSRDPYTCSATIEPQQGAITADLARQYFICKVEQVNGSGMLFLLDNVKVEVGKTVGRARDLVALMHDADPDGFVYPIRGSFDQYLCFPVDDSYGPHAHGQNCSVSHELKATGSCYRTGFGDWSCYMDGTGPTDSGVAPPGYMPANAAAPAAPAQEPTARISAVGPITSVNRATSGRPADGSPEQSAMSGQLSAADTDVQQGMRLFESGNYRAAYQKFHAVVEQHGSDPLPTLWEGVTRDALKMGGISFDYLAGNTDPKYSVISNELLALSSWHNGELEAAKEALDTCIRYNPTDTSCADMEQGIESGASAPDVKDWPADVGLIKATAARATVWKPRG